MCHENYGDDRLVKKRTNHSDKTSNKDLLLEQYISVCGHEYLCDSDLIPYHLKSNESYSSLIDCPKCLCHPNCFQTGTCCPDVFFSYPELSCDTVDILSSPGDTTKTFLLVNTCPEDTALELDTKCKGGNFSMKEQLFLPPVIATREGKYSLTFKNKYCAECNGFRIYNNWMLNFSCIEFADFNFLSSYDEIIELIRSKSCGVSFIPPDGEDTIECITETTKTTKYIDRCNTTGLWQEDRTDIINHACSSEYSLHMPLYENKLDFKNIFCYICNPPYHTGNVISECNVTTLWQPYDPELERSCLEYPEVAASYPFKNKFCQLCNADQHGPKLYNDASSHITTQSSDHNQYIIFIQSFESNYFFHIFDLDKMTVGNNTSSAIYDSFEKKNNVNLTNLFQKAYSLSPKNFCDKQWLPYNESMNTQRSFNFRYRSLNCYDFNFAFPASCYSSIRGIPLLQEEAILLLDQCFLVDNSYISRRFSTYCEGREVSETILSYIPVNDRYNDVNFKNILCALCNFNESAFIHSDGNNYIDGENKNDSEVYQSTDLDETTDAIKQYFLKLNGFQIRLDCPSFITFINYVTLYSVLTSAESMRCRIEFVPNRTYDYCKEKADVIGKCNVTGQWPKRDKDVEWACEKSLPGRLPNVKTRGNTFKNEFCDSCNPVVWNMRLISSCNETGLWLKYSPRIEQACKLLPQIYATFPFKNAFCRQCNLLPSGRGDGTKTDLKDTAPYSAVTVHTGGKSGVISLRNIFAMEEYDTDHQPIKLLQCFDNQIYDGVTKVCRNLTCYPGKVLNGSDCKPLLTVTSNLRYVITIMAIGTSSGNIRMSDILKKYQDSLRNNIRQALNRRKFLIEKMILLSNNSCSMNMTFPEQKFEIIAYIKFFVVDYVNRLRSEEDLIRMMNSSYSEFGFNVTFENSFERRALHAPTLIHESSFENSCYYRASGENIETLSLEEYRAVHVAPLLTCVQTTFSKHEYRLGWDQLTMLLVDLQLKLHFDEFQIMTNGDAVVCRNRISTYMSSPSVLANVASALGILTAVCLTVSIICLLLTLLTYGLFKPLRTLPGKNNIVLIVTLLAAQISVLIQPNVRQIDEVCIFVGSLSHYFWLCYFGSLIVCSVHMFRVFSGRLSRCESDSSINKTVLKYSLFSLGIPMIIVLIVVIVSLSTTGGRESGYSSFRCFISDRNVFIVTLITPLVVMCTCNLFFFAFTAYKIKTTPKVQKNKADNVHFLVYIKLFALTGLTWTIQIIDTFLVESFLSYVSVILNCTQGFFLFLSYVCNKRVLDMYKQKLYNRGNHSATNSSSRKTTKSNYVQNKTLSTDI
ncbi:hypothetical protein FSP39_009980 [Pinctada imbricata]|uniref:G-protein coupled receptors family 2 profile 2 domain-containing protein n=1 Tax=Pinctada imbricata TaxID=66713 RepID=A0AA88XLT7_PINIB|nr:hypothetical protein FSP39_009980 [Pinctada imbricata]